MTQSHHNSLLPAYFRNWSTSLRSYLTLLILLLSPVIIFGQEGQIGCDTLILRNRQVIEVQIDSVINHELFFRRCHSATLRPQKISIAEIKKIRGPFASTELYQNIINRKNITFEKDVRINKKNARIKKTLLPKIKWIFKDKKGKKKILSSQKKCYIYTDGNTNKLSGYIIEVGTSDITLITKKGETHLIPKEKVNRIIVPKYLRNLFLTLAIFFGFFGFIGLLATFDWGSWSGTILVFSVLLTGLAIVFALLSKQKKIEEPFSGKWKIEQIQNKKIVKASAILEMP